MAYMKIEDGKEILVLEQSDFDNAVDLDSVFSRQSELEDAINKEIKEKNLDFYMFAATDILNANSKIIAIGNKADTVEKAFGVNLENNTAMLNNVVSRKKQMLPNILNNLNCEKIIWKKVFIYRDIIKKCEYFLT